MNSNPVSSIRPVSPGSGVPAGNGSGNGSGIESRLAMIESRLATLEARSEFLATKEDIQKLSTLIAEKEASMQRWLIGVLLTAMVGMGIALIRLFS